MKFFSFEWCVLYCVLSPFCMYEGFSKDVPALQTSHFSTAQKNAWIKKIKDFLDFRTFQANFIQETNEGFQEGILSIQKPKKIRLEYQSSYGLVLLTENDWLKQYNTKTGEQEGELLIEETPAAFLLNMNQNFGQTFRFKNWSQTPGLLTVEVSSDALSNLDMTLRVVFETQPFALKQWVLIDSTGNETKVTLFNWKINPVLPDSLFTYSF